MLLSDTFSLHYVWYFNKVLNNETEKVSYILNIIVLHDM